MMIEIEADAPFIHPPGWALLERSLCGISTNRGDSWSDGQTFTPASSAVCLTWDHTPSSSGMPSRWR